MGVAAPQPVPVAVGHQGTVHDVGCNRLHKGGCACRGLAHSGVCCNASCTCKEHREVRRLAARGGMAKLRKRQRMCATQPTPGAGAEAAQTSGQLQHQHQKHQPNSAHACFCTFFNPPLKKLKMAQKPPVGSVSCGSDDVPVPASAPARLPRFLPANVDFPTFLHQNTISFFGPRDCASGCLKITLGMCVQFPGGQLLGWWPASGAFGLTRGSPPEFEDL